MKKILIIISTLLISINVYAKEYLIDSNEIISNQELDNLELISSNKLYNTYKLEKEYTSYDYSCTNYDHDDYKEERVFSNEESNDIYKFIKKEYTYDISAIFLSEFEDKNISEIEIYDGNNIVDYSVVYNSIKNYSLFNDGDYETYQTFTKQDYIAITLSKPVDNLELRIISNTPKSQFKLSRSFIYSKSHIINSSYYRANNFLIGNSYDYTNIDTSKSIYLHINKLYHCYNLNKIVLNEYVSSGDNIIEDDYIYEYHYKDDFIVNINDEYNGEDFINLVSPNENINDIKYETYYIDEINNDFYVKYIINNKYELLHLFKNNTIKSNEIDNLIINEESNLLENNENNNLDINSNQEKLELNNEVENNTLIKDDEIDNLDVVDDNLEENQTILESNNTNNLDINLNQEELNDKVETTTLVNDELENLDAVDDNLEENQTILENTTNDLENQNNELNLENSQNYENISNVNELVLENTNINTSSNIESLKDEDEYIPEVIPLNNTVISNENKTNKYLYLILGINIFIIMLIIYIKYKVNKE